MPTASTTEHLHDQRRCLGIDPIAMRVPEACRYLGIGRSTLYVLIAKSEVEIIKLGSATLVITASLRQLVESRRARANRSLADAGR